MILAAPIHFSGIKTRFAEKIPRVPYVHLHVTLLTTTARHPRPGYFNLRSSATVPTVILTTGQGARTPEFNSISYIGPLTEDKFEWVVKIFSPAALSDEWLADVFDGKGGWVSRKEVFIII